MKFAERIRFSPGVWALALGIALAGGGPRLVAAASGSPATSSTEVAEGFRAEFHVGERRIEIAVPSLPVGDYEVRLVTDGLTKPELGADVNEPGVIYLPPPAHPKPEPEETAVAENVFFFNELLTVERWELVAEFPEGARGTWKLNGRFSPLGGAIEREVVIPAERLESGENLLHVRSDEARVPTMFFRRHVAGGAASVVRVDVTPADWSGRVILLRRAENATTAKLAERSIATPASQNVIHYMTLYGGRLPAERGAGAPDFGRSGRVAGEGRAFQMSDRWWEDRSVLNDAAMAVGRSLLNSQVKTPGSLFEGGFHLVYDPQRRGHRMAHWIWAWGPSIDLLLKLSAFDTARADGTAERFRAAALAAGERSLQFGMRDPKHPASGVSTVRWEPSRATPLGWAEYLSTADSLFLAGWGWMSLHQATGRAEYLERTRTLVGAAERLMGQYPVVPQDWIVERSDWTPHTLDESVFGMIGFRRLHEATGARDVAAAGKRFLDSHLEHMGRESGLLARAWLREEDKEIWDPDIKGHAWVIEGYLDAHQLSGDTRYLRLADELAQKVIDCQAEHGGWTYLFKKPQEDDPIDDKGTAIWAYLFYDLYKSTKNPAHLAAARRALGWCLRHQYRGEDPNLDGAIFHPNSMAYVRRRPMTILYTTTFFGQALVEELALQKSGERR